ncbi:MAG: hypothetical protein ACYS8W_18370 [Planctomycetota bacterium]|jgi:hypothetical protein
MEVFVMIFMVVCFFAFLMICAYLSKIQNSNYECYKQLFRIRELLEQKTGAEENN